jgi:hypothetical protein
VRLADDDVLDPRTAPGAAVASELRSDLCTAQIRRPCTDLEIVALILEPTANSEPDLHVFAIQSSTNANRSAWQHSKVNRPISNGRETSFQNTRSSQNTQSVFLMGLQKNVRIVFVTVVCFSSPRYARFSSNRALSMMALADVREASLRFIWAPLLAAAVATVTISIALYYLGQPLLEDNAWRQTQTALTSYWMLKEGWHLAYQTPVLGYPWEIPLEFPLLQTIVAFVVWLGDLPLDATGRTVSLAFLLACAWPGFQIARRLRLPPEASWLFCALLWSAPIYIFNGRSFLIETAALFFVFAAIPYAIDLREARPSLYSAIAFALFASLGMLQKVSTAFPILLGLILIFLVLHIREHGLRIPDKRRLIIFVLAFMIPVAVTFLWFQYADSIRVKNPLIGNNESMIFSWFGGERLKPELLRAIFWDRIMVQNAGGLLGICVLAAGILLGSSMLRSIIFSGILFCFLTSFIFLRHHSFIYYYQTANTLFLIGALAVSLVSISLYIKKSAPALLLCSAIVAVNFYNYHYGYGKYVERELTPQNNATLAVSDVVRRYTPRDSAVIVFGLMSTGSVRPISAWSSEIAYYSERKSLTLTDGANRQVWSDPALFIGDKKLGAIVFCSTQQNRGRYEQVLHKYGSDLPPSLFKVSDCYVWLPGVDSIMLPTGKMVFPTRTFE